MTLSRCLRLLIAGLMLPAAASAQPPHPNTSFTARLAPSAPGPISGRVLVFAKIGHGDKEVDASEFDPIILMGATPPEVWVGAVEVHDLAPGASVTLDAAGAAYPKPFAAMPSGAYEAQAVLDPDHNYSYQGRGPADWVSTVVAVSGAPATGASATLLLDAHPKTDPDRAKHDAEIAEAVKPGEIELQQFESPLLTRFWGRAIFVRSYVVLPPGYAAHPSEHYPTVYWTAGFGGTLESSLDEGVVLRKRMAAGAMPPMIWVMLDESCPQGTHEFADSLNDGPRGAALTTEYIPMLEQRYRMDARPDGRFLNGHSSGGWAALQLQINYPQIFGGAWSTSPDAADFHDFTGVNLYAPRANVYRKPDGSAYPIMRMNGKVIFSLQQLAQLEQVIGPYGGQFTSFDWVFSPRSDFGVPEPMFDRQTGEVDPKVVAYWSEHYDLANMLDRTWSTRGPMLKGRIHVFVGTADTFYLDGAAHLLEARLTKLNGDSHFTYLPGRSHFDLYAVGTDRDGLFNQIAAEMYAFARPGVNWKNHLTP